jgi:hypothetical protein
VEDDIDLVIESGTFDMQSMKGRRHFLRIFYDGAQLDVFVGHEMSAVKAQTREFLDKLAKAVAEAQAKVGRIPD